MVQVDGTIEERMKYMEEIITKLENKENIGIESVIEWELRILKNLCKEKKVNESAKAVIRKEIKGAMTRYYLKDGSIYVVKGKDYRYLYDYKSKIMTYEFGNGQIERTFSTGLKEIRRPDGTIEIKDGESENDKFI